MLSKYGGKRFWTVVSLNILDNFIKSIHRLIYLILKNIFYDRPVYLYEGTVYGNKKCNLVEWTKIRNIDLFSGLPCLSTCFRICSKYRLVFGFAVSIDFFSGLPCLSTCSWICRVYRLVLGFAVSIDLFSGLPCQSTCSRVCLVYRLVLLFAVSIDLFSGLPFLTTYDRLLGFLVLSMDNVLNLAFGIQNLIS